MKIYSPKESNKFKTLINPSIQDIIPLVQIGDYSLIQAIHF